MARIWRKALSASLLLGLAACGHDASQGALTETVKPAPLQLQVHGSGEVKAVTATPLIVPGQQWSRRQLDWVLPNGTPVHKGQLVARFSADSSRQDLDQAKLDIRLNGLTRIGKEQDLSQQRGQLGVDRADTATQLAIAHRYAHAGELALARNKLLDSVQDEKFLTFKQGVLNWQLAQSASRGKAELAVIDAKLATLDIKAKQKRADLKALELRAPHDGVLVLKADWSGVLPHVGMNMWAGNPMGSLPDTTHMEVLLEVPQVQAQGVAVGQVVRLHPEGEPTQAIISKVSWVAPAAQARSRSNPVKYVGVKVPLPLKAVHRYHWRPGQHFSGDVVLLDAKRAISLPNVAIDTSRARATVQVEQGGTVVSRSIDLGVRGASRSQVTGGLKAGDVVVISQPPKDAKS
ncbi:HlyD family efflux transporter periplasmic adaptor subunit [Oleiagrimonas sp. C23AA]|nr:HlyD family efflux transporter periplasmic adaptor subunit [Oleiagrimonas sp. C23AA]